VSNTIRAIHQGFLPTQESLRAFVWKHSPIDGGRRPRHFHIEPELNLIASGRASFGVGKATVEVSRGDLLRFPPGQDHVLLEASPDLFLFAIGMDPDFSSQILRRDEASMAPLHMRLAPQDFEALLVRASAIVDRTGVEQPCAELWEHAHWLGRMRESRSVRPLHVLARRALSDVSRAPGLGLAALSASLHARASEVSRYFHQDVGMTFVQFRTRLRLLSFIRLVDTGMSLMSAAEASHFGSYSQCHRAFQAELGCSPRGFFHSEIRSHMQQAFDS
jgi:AraC-like DNA-binding protein/mannose-6-phosphate isomerase-like protein (cupin superfamily)